MHLNAKDNEYQRAVARIYDATPKAVWAAIAVSALTTGGDRLGAALSEVAHEWEILHANGIVPQRPPANVRDLAAQWREGA